MFVVGPNLVSIPSDARTRVTAASQSFWDRVLVPPRGLGLEESRASEIPPSTHPMAECPSRARRTPAGSSSVEAGFRSLVPGTGTLSIRAIQRAPCRVPVPCEAQHARDWRTIPARSQGSEPRPRDPPNQGPLEGEEHPGSGVTGSIRRGIGVAGKARRRRRSSATSRRSNADRGVEARRSGPVTPDSGCGQKASPIEKITSPSDSPSLASTLRPYSSRSAPTGVS